MGNGEYVGFKIKMQRNANSINTFSYMIAFVFFKKMSCINLKG